ncbi:hypothetical protein JCM16303_005665 [Sporobolomyces ruberrimus]
MSADLQADLLRFIATVPRNVDPYHALSDHVKDQFLPAVSNPTLIQLYCIATLLGVTLLLVLASMAIRIRKRIFWIYSISYSPSFLIVPHGTLSWSCVAAIMLVRGFFELFIAQCVKLFRKELTADLGYWIFLCWTSAWVGGALAAHSLGTGFLLQAGATSAPERLRRWSLVNNIAGVASPIVYLAIQVPLGVIGGQRFAKLVSTYAQFDVFIGDLSSAWQQGEALNIVKLTPALPLLDRVVEQQALLFASWRAVFYTYAVNASILVSVLVTIAGLHLSSLRRTIKESQASLVSDSAGRVARQQVARTWQTLVLTAFAFVLLGAIFVGISIFAALNPAALERSLEATIVVLVPLYAFGLLGFPTSALLVWRAIEAAPSETGSSQGRRSTFSKNGSRELEASKDNLNKYSIALGGRPTRSRNDARDLDVRFDGGAVSVSVEVEVKEEGEFDDDDDEKKRPPYLYE